METGIVALLLPAGITAVVAYAVSTTIYNVYFHPLAKFPGPPMAGVTFFWKAYVECIANRSFCHELDELHKRYGNKAQCTAIT